MGERKIIMGIMSRKNVLDVVTNTERIQKQWTWAFFQKAESWL